MLCLQCRKVYDVANIRIVACLFLSKNQKTKKMTFKDYYDSLPPKAPMAPKRAFVLRFAKLCKRSERTVYMWLMGVQKPDALAQSIIAKELGTTEQELFPTEHETH